jgi:hypothetical protein
MTDLAAVRARHYQSSPGPVAGYHVICSGCSQPWPCDADRLLAEIARVEGEIWEKAAKWARESEQVQLNIAHETTAREIDILACRYEAQAARARGGDDGRNV